MPVPRTYRFRIAAYIAVLLAFLVGVLALTYRSSSDLVLREAETSLARVVQQLTGQIKNEQADLAERARMVRDSTSFQEYLFITISLDTDPEAFREQYRRQFGWLQIRRSVVLSKSARAYVGLEHRDLVQALRARGLHRSPRAAAFYLDGPGGYEIVATAPIRYRSQHLGVVALTRTLDADWMNAIRGITGGELFLVRDGKIAMSTLGEKAVGRDFMPDSDKMMFGSDTYFVRRISLCDDPNMCRLYLALSQTELTGRLAASRNRMLAFALTGCIAVLIVGFLMLRNLGTPISRLAAMIGEVSQGRFPDFPHVPERDEIGYLWNQFAGMVRVLRDKQEEINKVHNQLEQLATTDALTGLYNRHYLYELFPKLYSEAQRQGKTLTVILADMDKFKDINDHHGHQAGDQALVHFSRILKDCSRISDFVFRTGGEEFLILTSGGIDGGLTLAEKIRSTTESMPFRHNDATIYMTASFGVAQTEAQDEIKDSRSVLHFVSSRADKMLYAAKRSGRNRVVSAGAELIHGAASTSRRHST